MTPRQCHSSRAAVCAGLLVSEFHFVQWYANRLGDGGEELLCLLAGLLALGTVPSKEWGRNLEPREWGAALGAVAIFAVCSTILRPLILGLTIFLSVVWLSRQGTGAWGRCLLAMAALPSSPSLQFYLGYPLRRLTTEATALLLNGFGAGVEARGTVLTGPAGEVAVDAACSGTHSLWVALFSVGVVATLARFDLPRVIFWGAAALVAVLLANVVRAALLYPFLTGRWPEFAGYHSGVGLLCFALWFLPWLRLAASPKEVCS